MNKVYTRINWENYPSEKTAVNESNLNKMDSALNEIDTRVVEHETTKANVASLNELINYWHIDETTGVITIHKVSGEQIIFDLNIEKVPVGFSMTDDGILIMTTDDGTEFTANIGSMIPVLTFNDSDQIAVAVSGEGVNKSYTFTIKTGSITEDKLQPNFLADCRLYAGNAENSALRAEEYAEQAKESADKNQEIINVINQASKSWMMPTDIEVAYQGIGVPNIDVVTGAYYLDVVSGNVYLGGTEWVLDRMLTSAQDKLNYLTTQLSSLGGVYSHNKDAINLASGVGQNILLFEADSDCLVNLRGYVNFSNNSTGARTANIMTGDGRYVSAFNANAVTNNVLNAPAGGLIKLSKGDNLKVILTQNSGSTITATLNIEIGVMYL